MTAKTSSTIPSSLASNVASLSQLLSVLEKTMSVKSLKSDVCSAFVLLGIVHFFLVWWENLLEDFSNNFICNLGDVPNVSTVCFELTDEFFDMVVSIREFKDQFFKSSLMSWFQKSPRRLLVLLVFCSGLLSHLDLSLRESLRTGCLASCWVLVSFALFSETRIELEASCLANWSFSFTSVSATKIELRSKLLG